MNLKVKPPSSSLFVYCYCLLFFLVLSFDISNAQNAITDPSEVEALNSIFQKWDLEAVALWNTTGDPCSGSAIEDGIDFEDPRNNPAIKCDCTYENSTTCHITRMRVFSLNKRGVLPEELVALKFLTYLKIDQNYFTGPLPAFIGNLSALTSLSIAHNVFSGTIPKELGNLKELTLLSLSVNNFSGTLPPELGNLVKLEQIYINSCVGLGGEIPSTFANLKSVRIMRASDTPFTGKIPDFIGNWTKLTALRFQGNSFTGPIPSSFSNLTSLESLRIGDIYNVSSSLDFIKNLKSLSSLVLRNALITGSIPSDIGEYQRLQTLDLSFNNLTGEIPSGLFNIGSLQDLDLSYNRLSGRFPSWVAASSNLQLNLVANNFIFDSSNISVLPGLNCLQRNFPCNRNSPVFLITNHEECNDNDSADANFSIKCGGKEMPAEGITYEAENSSSFGAAWFYVTQTEKWAVSNVGLFAERNNQSYVENTLAQVIGTKTPELYEYSRMSPGSLRYYGLGLDNGLYNVSLFFAETGFDDRSSQTWKSLGRRVFNIYIQGSLESKDFDISKEAGGVERAIRKNFMANVSENYLEIHLFWAGKGTCCTPVIGYYGPLISAIHVASDFVSTVPGILPSTPGEKSKLGLIIGIAVAVGVVTLILIFAVFYMKRKSLHHDEDEFLGMGPRPNTFSYAELRSATEDFNPSNKLGEGGFGPVFKGTLSDGRIVAVKQLSVASHQGKSQFVTEISTISAVQHRNLVKLYGCCIDGDRRLLVYEYLENRSLDQALFGKSNLRLDWPTRFSVCLGTARGLAYLHEDSRPRIVHRDVKASNILIDRELCPKISDFGLAKLYDDTKTHISTRVAGTIGYLAPEYAMRGHLTEKADVFGFGVVALEILSGRPNSDNNLDTEKIYLLEWAWTLHENNQSLRLVDPTLTEFDEGEAARVIAISFLCTQASPMMRPSMSRVVAMLVGDIEVGIVTSKPSYLSDWNFKDITSSFLSEEDRKQRGDNSNSNSQLSGPIPSSVNVTETMLGCIIGDGR
ncbi:probable LRR receptor-like serine/threonine-protein kinase At1g56130 [Fagus crenata]